MAGTYPCRDIDLIAFLPHGEIGGGYTDAAGSRGFVYDRGRVTDVFYTPAQTSFVIDWTGPGWWGPESYGLVEYTYRPEISSGSVKGLSNRGDIVGEWFMWFFTDVDAPFTGIGWSDGIMGQPVP